MPQACEALTTSGAARPPLWPIDPSRFQRWLTVATLELLLLVLLGFALHVCASILQPLFIAGLLVYLILPVHQRLVRWRVPSAVTYLLILAAAEADYLDQEMEDPDGPLASYRDDLLLPRMEKIRALFAEHFGRDGDDLESAVKDLDGTEWNPGEAGLVDQGRVPLEKHLWAKYRSSLRTIAHYCDLPLN
jgi:hypothetical protein